MTKDIAPDAVVNSGRQHAVLKGMAQRVEGVAWCFQQAVGAQELVQDRAQAGTVAIAGEAVGNRLKASSETPARGMTRRA